MKLFLSTLLLMLLFSCCCNEKTNVDRPTNKIDSIGVLWERVHHCSKLEVAEYTVLKTVSFDDKSQLKLFGYSTPLPGEKRLMIPIEVKMKITVDLGFVTRDDIYTTDSTINLTLPAPKIEITSTKIDHEKSQESVPGLLIYDAIQASNLDIRIVCTGLAASMAAIILVGAKIIAAILAARPVQTILISRLLA
ncbi:MAG: DUF4230 domain-containing protein, partial [Paludibacteraceae bacterium]|nr:DUF4230 domain-containing protein [Paludibacteraceae bacterium]